MGEEENIEEKTEEQSANTEDKDQNSASADNLRVLENIDVKDKNIINKPEIKKIIKNAVKLIKGNGRILVRKSGTESKIRVMGESENKFLLYKCVNMITKKIK